MSDNEDLLGDDLGDQSLADYNLGNEEEEQLLADDYESAPQNVPSSIRDGYTEVVEMLPSDYPSHAIQYAPPPMQYQPIVEAECVVPNITVEVANLPPHSTYTPIEQRHYEAEHAVPPAIPAGAIEPPQIVPSEIIVPAPNEGARARFVSERPAAGARMPRVRDIPDSLDKVVIPGGGGGGAGRTWRAPHYTHPRHRAPHPYRRHHRGNFNQRNSFPPPQHIIRPNIPPQIIRQEIRPDIRPHMIRPDIRPDIVLQERPEMIRPDRPEMIRPDRPEMIRPERPEMMRPEMREMIRPEMREMIRPDGPPEMLRPDIRPDMIPEIRELPPQMGPEISPERAILPDMFRPAVERPFFPRFQFRAEERMFPVRPMYPFPRPPYNPRFAPPMREIVANSAHLPQITIRQGVEPEPLVRMLPLGAPRAPPAPPAPLPGKKVLINPHFKGNYHPVEGLPAYIPTRIQKSPPRTPPLGLGPVKDIDDAAERFIAEQRSALARAAGRKQRRSPQRYIENTTIEIENELARARLQRDDDLLRRQEDFINANRAGLRRRMRSASPPAARRSASPPAAPPLRRARASPPPPPRDRHDEQESEYKRRLREQESLRDHVLRAKEVRRRRNAAAMHKQLQDKERETLDKTPPQPAKDAPPTRAAEPGPATRPEPEPSNEETKPDTTRTTPDKSPDNTDKVADKRERSPPHKDDEVNSTCEALTPPAPAPAAPPSSLTPPWRGSDDDLDMILGDIDGILSDDDDSGRFKDKPAKVETAAKSKPVTDLRSKLPPKPAERAPRQKIVFEEKERKKREKTPTRRGVVSSTRADDGRKIGKPELEKDKQERTPPFSNRRVILQRKVPPRERPAGGDHPPAAVAAGIFSRAVRTIEHYKVKKDEPQIEYESDSDIDEDRLLNDDDGSVAQVDNLPHGMTDTRLRTLAGNDVQSLILDKEERSANITFKSARAADVFKKKFNGKMVAASRLTVTLR